jgi:hypothetical protein
VAEVEGIELASGTESVSEVDIAFRLLPHPAMKDAIRNNMIARLQSIVFSFALCNYAPNPGFMRTVSV